MSNQEQPPPRQVKFNYWVEPLENDPVDIQRAHELTQKLVETIGDWAWGFPREDSPTDSVLIVAAVNLMRVTAERVYTMQERQVPEDQRWPRVQFMSWLGEVLADQFEDLADGLIVEEQAPVLEPESVEEEEFELEPEVEAE